MMGFLLRPTAFLPPLPSTHTTPTSQWWSHRIPAAASQCSRFDRAVSDRKQQEQESEAVEPVELCRPRAGSLQQIGQREESSHFPQLHNGKLCAFLSVCGTHSFTFTVVMMMMMMSGVAVLQRFALFFSLNCQQTRRLSPGALFFFFYTDKVVACIHPSAFHPSRLKMHCEMLP